jgi:hypothetical protein
LICQVALAHAAAYLRKNRPTKEELNAAALALQTAYKYCFVLLIVVFLENKQTNKQKKERKETSFNFKRINQ